MRVSVILTVLNEGEAIRAVLDSLMAQTRSPDEVVIADGGSHDDTLSLIRQYENRLPLRLIEVPGANISQGRNAAIRAASGDVIAATDAGVRCEPEWLAKLIVPFEHSPLTTHHLPFAVAGFFVSDPHTVLETAMGATVLPDVCDIDPQTYLPSSRSVAFRKEAWAAVGGYPEWLDFCEDVIFDLRVREQYGPFVFAPEARVCFRPRGSLRALAKQYYQYARGDGKANLFPKQHAVRYAAYLVVAPLLAYAALSVNAWLWLAGVAAGLAYIRGPLRRLWPRLAALSWAGRAQSIVYVPLIRFVGDVAKMAGYPVGVAWRLRSRPPA